MRHAGSQRPQTRGGRLVVAIGVFRLVKSALLVAFGVGALLGVPDAIVNPAIDALRWAGAFHGHTAVRGAVVRLLSLDEQEMRALGIVCLVYAAVFAVEGVGLIRERRWAEWLTVVVTGSFIPFEIYELVRHPGAGKIAALAVNIAIVAYLAWRRLTERHPGSRLRVSRIKAA